MSLFDKNMLFEKLSKFVNFWAIRAFSYAIPVRCVRQGEGSFCTIGSYAFANFDSNPEKLD
jgi:hypothetical protein